MPELLAMSSSFDPLLLVINKNVIVLLYILKARSIYLQGEEKKIPDKTW
jgi:hypothetical protein